MSFLIWQKKIIFDLVNQIFRYLMITNSINENNIPNQINFYLLVLTPVFMIILEYLASLSISCINIFTNYYTFNTTISKLANLVLK